MISLPFNYYWGLNVWYAAPFPTGARQGRNLWTMNETERLYKGVQRQGVGKWAEVKIDQHFVVRTGVQLKDRWRTILKDNKLMSALVEKFGDLE